VKRIAPWLVLVGLAAVPPGVLAADPAALACVPRIANFFALPPVVLDVVLQLENGTTGVEKRHPNGSVDLGAAQISTQHLATLSKLGIDRSVIVHDACINVAVAAWHLKRDFDALPQRESAASRWAQALLNYHSRTPRYRAAYQARAINALRQRTVNVNVRRRLRGSDDSRLHSSDQLSAR
jgi:hypothetical protein